MCAAACVDKCENLAFLSLAPTTFEQHHDEVFQHADSLEDWGFRENLRPVRPVSKHEWLQVHPFEVEFVGTCPLYPAL